MLKIEKKLAGMSFLILFATAACTVWTQKDAMQLFAFQMNNDVAKGHYIYGYLNPKSAVVLLDSREVRPGVMEYSFEDKRAKWASGIIIGWRYNGNPNYCTANP